jgi:diguanylate cyclase (GGDEF)-like protein
MPTPTVILDARKPGFPIVNVNDTIETLIGRDADELIGLPFTDILTEGHMPECWDADDSLSVRQKWHTRDGVSVPLDVRILPLLDRVGQPGFWMLSVVGDALLSTAPQAQDTADLRNELVNAQRQIKSLQRTDPVSGLVKRGAFDEVLERDWSIARREQRRIGVIVFSVDCLDEYRQIFGRHATDSLLRKIGHAIGGTLRRAGDLGARITNDRFAVLIGDSAEDQTKACANRIASKVRDLAIHHPRSTEARFATVSYGVASEVPAWTKKSVTLLEEAERQLDIRAPAAGRSQSVTAAQTDDEEVIT